MKNWKKPITILVPDGHSHLFPSVLIGLSEIKGLHIHVLSEKRFIPARFSRYVIKFHHFRPAKQDVEWVDSINRLVQQYDIDVVLPIHDTTIRRLIEHTDKLERKDCFLLPSSLEDFDLARDKDKLTNLLKDLGIPVPDSWFLPEEDPMKGLPESNEFPVLLKPTRVSGSGRGIMRFTSKAALSGYLSENPLPTHCFIQREIQGYDLTCHMLCKEGDILAINTQKGFLFSPRPFTPQVGMQVYYDRQVHELAATIMKRLFWNGVANIDMRYDQSTDTISVLEINPRFWLTLVASQVAGINYPWLYCQTVLGETFDIPKFKKCDYYTWNGLRVALRKQPTLFCNPIAVWKKSPIKFALRDPLMTLVEFIQTLGIYLRSKFRR